MGKIRVFTVRAAIIGVLFAPALTGAQVASELHITPDGTFDVKNLTVMQKSGTNLFTRATWGRAFIRVIVLTNASTTVVKKHGEASSVREIADGHMLEVKGTLTSNADSIIINASYIRNLVLERESKTISGTILIISTSTMGFALSGSPNPGFRATNVVLSATTTILKGARTIQFRELAVGDRVLSVSGMYNYQNNALSAASLEIYQNTAMFTPRNFQGTLKNVSGTTLPTSLTMSVEGADYTVYLNQETAVLNKNKSPTNLKRFAEGDTVRFYGAIRKTNFSEIDAEVVRDLEF